MLSAFPTCSMHPTKKELAFKELWSSVAQYFAVGFSVLLPYVMHYFAVLKWRQYENSSFASDRIKQHIFSSHEVYFSKTTYLSNTT